MSTAVVVVACTHCRAKLRTSPEMVGRRVKCPKCQKPFEIPKEEPAVADSIRRGETPVPEAATVASPDAIRSAVAEALLALELHRVPSPVLGAVVCGLVRALHYALPVLAGSLLAYHVLMHQTWLVGAAGTPGAAMYWSVLALLGVLSVAAIGSHVGPPTPKEGVVTQLDASNAPLLIELVSDLSERFDVPHGELRTSWDASLEERNGHFYIGASALANLSVTEVVGALARCLAVRRGKLRRFTRSEYNRLHRLLRPLNDKERGSWQARLRHWASIPGRPVTWPLAVIVKLFTEDDLRRFELEADRLHAQLLGSQRVFVAVQRHRLVRYAVQITQADLPFQFQDKSLRANRPHAVQENLRSLPEEVQQSILSIPLDEDEEAPYCPAWSERLAAGEKHDYPSLLDLRTPAELLVADFEKFCRDLTWIDCQQMFGPLLKRRELKD
jgi:hypothetical protein